MVEIKGLEKLAPRDFPGHISATVFTGGCNFRCPYCQNADLVLRSGSLVTISRESFWEFLDVRRGWLEAVCVTGGEPLMHEDLEALLAPIKTRHLLVKIDTNGSYPERLRNLVEMGLVDFIAMDIKAHPNNYAQAAGVPADFSAILESISVIRNSGCRYVFRTTVVPGLVKEEDTALIAQMLKGEDHYVLQKFVPHHTLDPDFADRPPTCKDQLMRMANRAREYIPRVSVEGI